MISQLSLIYQSSHTNHQQNLHSKNRNSQIMISTIVSSWMCNFISDVIIDIWRTGPRAPGPKNNVMFIIYRKRVKNNLRLTTPLQTVYPSIHRDGKKKIEREQKDVLHWSACLSERVSVSPSLAMTVQQANNEEIYLNL